MRAGGAMRARIRAGAPVLFVFAALFLTLASEGGSTGPQSTTTKFPEVSAIPEILESSQISGLPRGLSAAEKQAFRAGNDFGFELLRRLHAERSDDGLNVFISPLSLSMSLGMLMNGAGGGTLSAMVDALGLNGLILAEANEVYRALAESLVHRDPSVDFRLANTSWLEEGLRFRRDYRDRVQESFGARIETVRFQESDIAGVINGWVDNATEGRVANLVTAEEFKGMLALLVNTIYFKGEWTDPFDPAQTAMVDFRRADGSTVSVPMMRQDLDARVGGGEGSGEDFVVLEMPYGAQSFSMMVVVPIGNATLAGMVERMDGERWQDVVDALRGEERTEIMLPRFELTSERELNDVLKAMGMAVAFDQGSADFGWLLGDQGSGVGPYIGQLKQKIFLRVDEEGTETAAATGTAVAIPGSPALRAVRPFLFAIRERASGAVLFLGTVGDPGG